MSGPDLNKQTIRQKVHTHIHTQTSLAKSTQRPSDIHDAVISTLISGPRATAIELATVEKEQQYARHAAPKQAGSYAQVFDSDEQPVTQNFFKHKLMMFRAMRDALTSPVPESSQKQN